MNYYQTGNPIVDATWGLALEGLKRRYQMMKKRQPTAKELEAFRYRLCDPKPTEREVQRFFKQGGK